MVWAPYGENAQDDRDRLWMWIEHGTDGDADGWASVRALRHTFKITGTNPSRMFRQDLERLYKAGRLERRCDNPNAHWRQRRIFYRALQPEGS